jgi:hypothetical protein
MFCRRVSRKKTSSDKLTCLAQLKIARQFLWRLLVGGSIERHRRTTDRMPGGDPADEGPGVIAPLPQFLLPRCR